jgi:D-amino-acid dehydrogenase
LKSNLPTIVIGAGIVGVSTALHLLMRGQNVVLIDRKEPGQETSFGNGGIIEASYVLPFGFPAIAAFPQILLNRDTSVLVHYPTLLSTLPWMLNFFLQSQPKPRRQNGRLLRPLADVAVQEHRALMGSAGAERYLRKAGRAQVFRTAQSFEASAALRVAADDLSVPYEVFDAPSFQSIEPHLAPIFHRAVTWPTSARVTEPGAVTALYAARFAAEGGTIRRAQVASLHPLGDETWEVKLDCGALKAARVVVCAGPWSPELLAPLGYKFPLAIKRGYHQHFTALNGAVLNHAIADYDVGYLIVPTELGYRITTGVEYARVGTPPNPVHIERALPHARELFPLGERIGPSWVGNRPCFADSLPVVGRAFRHNALWLNFGHGHSGFTIGPSSGHLLADMVCGGPLLCDPHAYRPERFWK